MTAYTSVLLALPNPVNTKDFSLVNVPKAYTFLEPVVQSGGNISLLITYDPNNTFGKTTWSLSWLIAGTDSWDDTTSFILGYIGIPQGVYLLVKH